MESVKQSPESPQWLLMLQPSMQSFPYLWPLKSNETSVKCFKVNINRTKKKKKKKKEREMIKKLQTPF